MSTTRHLFLLVFLALMCSCSKEGKFLGTSDYSTEVIIKAYTSSGNEDYVKIQIGDTTIDKLPLSGTVGLDQVLDYKFKLPENGRAKIKIWWKDTDTLLADTIVTLAAKNEYALVQLNPKKPHEFSTQFGNNGEAVADTGSIKARFVYIKGQANSLAYPDTLQLRFIKLYKDRFQNYVSILPDTFSVTAINGIVSNFITLPDSRIKFESDLDRYDISLGYQILNPKTGAILKDFCYDITDINIVDYASLSEGSQKFYTIILEYNEAGLVCPIQTTETYELRTLFTN